MSLKGNNDKSFLLRLPQNVYDAIKDESTKSGVPMNQIILNDIGLSNIINSDDDVAKDLVVNELEKIKYEIDKLIIRLKMKVND